MNTFKFTIGADPELFVGRAGKFVSAHDLVKGDKLNPTPVPNGAVQVDGMALEFNIDPAKSEHEWLNNLESVLGELRVMVSEDLDFLKDVSVFFEDDDIKDVPNINKILGCSPDFNAYNMRENQVPNAKMNMRTAGGHVHVGGLYTDNEYDWEHFTSTARLARLMDKYVGVYSVLWDKDDQRRKLYGGAGAFRPKLYGMEYRTMSNAWLWNKDICSFVYNQTRKAVDAFLDKEDNVGSFISDIINTSDRDNTFFLEDQTAIQLKEVVNAGV